MMIQIVWIDEKYINFLREYDKKVCFNKNESRPYVGVLFAVKGNKYFAPLSSPKDKFKKRKNDVDFMRIDAGNLGYINFNNMIPVPDNAILPRKIEHIKRTDYKKLLYKQLKWLKKHEEEIVYKASKLYKSYKNRTLRQNVYERCCNFFLLEKKMKGYVL